MIRSVLAVATLVLLALLGVWVAWGTYDLASIYGDPTGSRFESLAGFGSLLVIAIVVLAGVAAVAVSLAPGRLRRVATVAAVSLLGASLVGIVVGNYLGIEAKKLETAAPPECGIGNVPLDEEFRSIDHPGYFGGGSASRTDCSYLLTTEDSTAALDEYDEELRARGYDVTRSGSGLRATREGFTLTVAPGVHGKIEPTDSPNAFTVTLAELG